MSASLALTLALALISPVTTDFSSTELSPDQSMPAEGSMLRQAVIGHLLARVDALSPDDQLELYLGQFPSETRRSFTLHGLFFSVDQVAEDPALDRVLPQLENVWLLPSLRGEIPMAARLIETKVIVARNLHLQSRQPSKANVGLEIERLHETRRRLADEPLFAGRNVIFTASNEKLPDGRPAFGRDASRHALENQAAELFASVPERNELDAFQFDWLLRRAPKVTLVFEGHSDGDALQLPHGALEAGRLAELLAARSAELPAPILVLDTCYGHDFARRLISELAQLGGEAARPLIVIPEEFGLPRIKEVFGAGLLRGVLYGTPSAPTTAGSVLRSFDRRLSLYAAEGQNRMMHVG